MSFEHERRDPLEEETRLFCFFLFAYGFIYAFFHIMPVCFPTILRKPLTYGDALDFLTPFFVIPLAYLLYFMAKRVLLSSYSFERNQGIVAKLVLAAGFILYIDGHGLHLSSNSIARLIQSEKTTELFQSVYLFDEVISHFMWHSGVFLISVGLMVVARNLPVESLNAGHIALLVSGALFYGFNFTVGGIEGQTVVMTLPAAFSGFLLAVFFFWREKKRGLKNPFFLFFTAAYLLSVLLFAYWGLTHSGFPQFSELGWIR